MSRKTTAAVLVETNAPLQVMEIEIPDLKNGQVLVDIAYSGICHSQLNEVNGLRGPDKFLPHTLGHEGSGTVIKTGPNVNKVKKGDRVVLTWLKGSGTDVPSTNYGSEIGTLNSGAISTFMRQTVVSENRLVPIPDTMPFKEAALLGCAIPTGSGIVLNDLNVQAGQTLAVFGVGGIGISAVMAACALKASKIIAIDVLEDKLELARELGATHTINAATENVASIVSDITDGTGVDFAIEAAGKKEVIESAFQSVRNGGGKCIVAGNPPHGTHFEIDPFDLIRGKMLVGSWGGGTNPDTDFPRYISMYSENQLPLEKLLGKEYELEDINRALSDLEDGRVLRPLIKMD
jgi:S-(hydroxymethyl)glutathione dehydrogenase/alcohol dehydrogenase